MPPKRNQGRTKGGSGKDKKEKFTWDEPEEQATPQAVDDEPVYKATPWTGSGNLESLPLNRDIKIGKFSVSLQGVELVKDTTLELNHGRRYGLIGLNGSGKSTMMRVLGERQVPIPPSCDIYHLTGYVCQFFLDFL
jgi:ATP-binding cassette subfamily F protein 2